jgi:hypothetical protein
MPLPMPQSRMQLYEWQRISSGWSCEWCAQVDDEIHQETWMVLGNDTYDNEIEPDSDSCRSAGSRRNLGMHDE